jgi:16S rRNA processing protein RimM
VRLLDANPTPSPPTTRWLLIACVVGVHGVRGALKLRVFSDEPLGLTRYKQLFTANGAQAYTLERIHAQGIALVAHFAEITNRTQAEALRELELFVARDALVPEALEPGMLYQADLLGLHVITPTATKVGHVTRVENYGAGDLLEITPMQGAPFLVPYRDVAVLSVDLAQGQLILDPAFLPQ